MAMGAANVIPGVSGGTIAFITNIYERLINALKAFDLLALRLLFRMEFKVLARKVDLAFLAAVGAGVVVSILSLAKALELAFVHYEELTLSFFFGLILASIISVGRQIGTWNMGPVVGFLVGTTIAVSIAFLAPSSPNSDLFYVFLCGIVAVCSMILPGLSGSYILLLMGNYILVLQAISSFNFGILIPLLVGCVVGLVIFSRVLAYLFSHFKDLTVALLTGFVTGSLLIIWPWKRTQYESFEGKIKAVGYEWTWPSMDLGFGLSILLIVAGFAVVYFIDRAGEKQ